MAARKKTTRKAASARTAAGRAGSALKRIEPELPPNLREFSRRVRSGLGRLERQIEQAQASARREAARLLRDASHALGRFEAEGERRWRKLAAPARREALRLLQRLEKAMQPPARKKAARKVSRPAAPRSVAPAPGASPLTPPTPPTGMPQP